MGKQGGAVNRVALANALNTSGQAKVPPPIKEAPKPPPKEPKPKKVQAPPEPVKTRKDIQEEQRQHLEEQQQRRAEFYATEAARKAEERKPADESFTYVEDKDSRKPVAIPDISDFWTSPLEMCPFLPGDNAGMVEVPSDVDVNERLQYLHRLNEQLEHLLRMRFHVFWSQVLFDRSILRTLDSYLRFALRSHDVSSVPEAREDELGPLVVEERALSQQISRRVLAVLRRLSTPQETSHDHLSPSKFCEYIEQYEVFDIPKIVDLCALYGDSNRQVVTRMVHSLFQHVPSLLPQFKDVVQHMLGSLLESCRPLSRGGDDSGIDSLSLDDCLAFLPDVLSCFNAVFCFFPEECVETLLTSSLQMPGIDSTKDDGIDIAELMVVLYTALDAVDEQSVGSERARLAVNPQVRTIRSLLCRLLSCVLGFRMSPRLGASAFQDLVEWCINHSDRHPDLLKDLGKHGFENVAVEWLASGLVDDAQIDYLEELCGQMLPPEVRRRRRPRKADAQASGAGAASSSSTAAPQSRDTASDKAKIREVREVVGSAYGDGFILQCLLHFSGSVPAVLENILEGTLPPQLETLPKGLKIGEDPSAANDSQQQLAPNQEDKKHVMQELERMERAAAAMAAEVDEYDDDYDDTQDAQERFNVGANRSDSEKSDSDGKDDDEESSEGEGGKGKGGKGGKGKGRPRGPTQGQTYQARRKEENKGRIGNHNRRDGALRKMQRGMM